VPCRSGGRKDLIIAALETGCRRGELLSLQWNQVLRSGESFFPVRKTKAKKPRRVPISSVLQGVLDARRHDPAGKPLPADKFVFGDEIARERNHLARAIAEVRDLLNTDIRIDLACGCTVRIPSEGGANV
jgi:integrase